MVNSIAVVCSRNATGGFNEDQFHLMNKTTSGAVRLEDPQNDSPYFDIGVDDIRVI